MDPVDVTSPEHARVLFDKIRVLPRDYPRVTEDALRKAREELNEINEKMVEESLKNLLEMTTVNDIWIRNLGDDALICFLRARKFNLLRSLDLLRHFQHFHRRYPDIQDTFSLEVLQPAMDELLTVFLPYRTPEGCAIGIGCITGWDTHMTSFTQFMQMVLMCFETELQNPMTQICGGVLIADFRGVGWNHFVHFTPSNLKCFFTALNNGIPFRLKELHFISSSSIFGLIFSLITPFFGERLKPRIKCHGEDMSSLHRYISPDILPAEYGGHLGPMQDYGFFDAIRQYYPHFGLV